MEKHLVDLFLAADDVRGALMDRLQATDPQTVGHQRIAHLLATLTRLAPVVTELITKPKPKPPGSI